LGSLGNVFYYFFPLILTEFYAILYQLGRMGALAEKKDLVFVEVSSVQDDLTVLQLLHLFDVLVEIVSKTSFCLGKNIESLPNEAP
jgi:hypothetical protein